MQTKIKRIAIVGSTGSIGGQTLDIISDYPDLFKAQVLVAGSNVDALIMQSIKFRPAMAVIARKELYPALRVALEPYGIATAAGPEAICEAVERDDVDTVVTATVGYSGLAPTLRAIRAGKDIALANKETLVVAGELVNAILSQSRSKVIPVDSEHSAIYQCLAGENPASVSKLIITASGGPFLHHTAEQLRSVTTADALRHPKWQMGAKITVDSASMMNKAFEIIEARWLFDVDESRIEALVHPQSIVHSMVEFVDGAVKAQLGVPDMHIPIRYALGDASRMHTSRPGLSLADFATLTFELPDCGRFPCLTLAHKALRAGGTTACTINAANEIAVDAFLKGNLRFTDIYPLIEATLDAAPGVDAPAYEDYVAVNDESRAIASQLVKSGRF